MFVREAEMERFSWEETKSILSRAKEEGKISLDEKGKKFLVNDGEKLLYEVQPPLVQPIQELDFDRYLAQVSDDPGLQMFSLIQAGSAALGVWDYGQLRLHKVIQKYMVRKKRGKAQVTYLNQKGKSRAGSRIRLRQTKEFYEEIHEKWQEWFEEIEDCQQLFYSCGVRMWGELFNSQATPALDRKDSRWIKVPLDVKVPNLKELEHICYEMSHGTITKDPL